MMVAGSAAVAKAAAVSVAAVSVMVEAARAAAQVAREVMEAAVVDEEGSAPTSHRAGKQN